MLLPFLSVTGLLFWLFVLLAVVIQFVVVYDTKASVAVFMVPIFFVLMFALFSDVDVFGFIARHYILTVLFVPFYFVLGVVWAVYKWQCLVADSLQKFLYKRDEFRGMYQNRGPSQKDSSFEEYVRGYRAVPEAAKYKDEIIVWIAGWPFSMMLDVFEWPVRFATILYNRLLGVFERAVKKAFGGHLST